MAYKRYRKQDKLDIAEKRRKKFVIVNWRELPVSDQIKIYKSELYSYLHLYTNNMRKLKKTSPSDTEYKEHLDNVLTSLFLRYICKRKFGKSWHLIRAQVEGFIGLYKHKTICYAYFLKNYRDNPEVFDMYVNEFNKQFDIKLRIINTTRIDPSIRKMMALNRVGGHRYAGAGI